jgi:hypothetical protein
MTLTEPFEQKTLPEDFGASAQPPRYLFGLLLTLSSFNAAFTTCLAQGTAFTYQGRLIENGAPANGTYDLVFTICDSPGGAGVAHSILRRQRDHLMVPAHARLRARRDDEPGLAFLVTRADRQSHRADCRLGPGEVLPFAQTMKRWISAG